MKKLIFMKDLDGNPAAYLIDFSAISKSMFEMMPMSIPEPVSFRPSIFSRDFGPMLRIPTAVLQCDDGPEPLKFFYLFPLGKRAFVRKCRN